MSASDHTDPKQYAELFREKCDALQARFADFTLITAERFPSPPLAFRFRAEFSLWHEPDRLRYAMHEPGKRGHRIPIENFPIGSSLMQQLMPLLLKNIQTSPLLQEKLFEIEFLTSRHGQALVTLIYHKVLTDEWQAAARELKKTLQETISQLHIMGRSRGQKICVDQDFIEEKFTVAGVDYRYQQIESSFTQPNAFINEMMLNWAFSVTKNIGGDLLELYCGNGNFTLPLSKNFGKVLATEVSKTSLQAALHNSQLNNIHNIHIARLSSEEAAQAITRIRPFRRLQPLNLDDYHFSTVFVDPPRAGLDPETLELAKTFEHICYISCNPDTLADNLRTLMNTHRIKYFAMFDQFPYTPHMECGVFLERSSCASKGALAARGSPAV